MANTDSGIIVFDSKSLTVFSMINPSLPTYAVNWLANDEVGYSLYQDKRWQLYQQNINSNVSKRHDQRWAFSLASPKGQLYIDQSMTLYFNESIVSSELSCAYPISRMALTIHLEDEIIYCIAEQDKEKILKYSEQLGVETIKTSLTRVRRFSIASDKLATTRLTSSRSDIIRTNYLSNK